MGQKHHKSFHPFNSMHNSHQLNRESFSEIITHSNGAFNSSLMFSSLSVVQCYAFCEQKRIQAFHPFHTFHECIPNDVKTNENDFKIKFIKNIPRAPTVCPIALFYTHSIAKIDVYHFKITHRCR